MKNFFVSNAEICSDIIVMPGLFKSDNQISADRHLTHNVTLPQQKDLLCQL